VVLYPVVSPFAEFSVSGETVVSGQTALETPAHTAALLPTANADADMIIAGDVPAKQKTFF
jgi:hypothetical protein